MPTPPPIRILPAAVTARIAAGEVVERPASVVKELIENALDAGASRVRIDVEVGGLRLIRVTDNGHGIPAGELPLALVRHATSKLTGDDLADVRTLGFRGEALPSIIAVADVTIISAADTSGVGRRLEVVAGRTIASSAAPRPRGTTVSVRGLFQRLPVRLAAAAKGRQETGQIAQVVRRLALSAPDVQFEFVVDGRLAVSTSGAGDSASALVAIYGPAIAPSLAALEAAPPVPIAIGGIVAGAEVTRPSRAHVTLVVNGRWVQPRGLLAALETAYRPLLPRGRHPVLLATIDVPPERLDINIHPTKLEVRLLDEPAIASALAGGLRAVLGRRPRALAPTSLLTAGALLAPSADGVSRTLLESRSPWDGGRPIITPNLPPLRLIGQLHDRLLLLEGESGLFLLDQHRAHERVLYEQFRPHHDVAQVTPLVEPLVLELTPGQVRRFERQLTALAALGFDCEVFGDRTFLVRAVPALPGVVGTPSGSDDLSGLGHVGGLTATLLALADEEAGDGEEWRQRLLVSLACRTAVRRGQPLQRPAMIGLVQALGQTNAPAVCPHGSPLLVHVTDATLARQFDWRL